MEKTEQLIYVFHQKLLAYVFLVKLVPTCIRIADLANPLFLSKNFHSELFIQKIIFSGDPCLHSHDYEVIVSYNKGRRDLAFIYQTAKYS